MRPLLVSFIILGFLFQAFNKVGLMVSYQFNKDFISANFCENKDKPALHCDGKCHLAKQLQKADSEESKNPSQRSNLQDAFNLFSAQNDSFSFKPVEQLFLFFSVYIEQYTFQHSISLYHPPTA